MCHTFLPHRLCDSPLHYQSSLACRRCIATIYRFLSLMWRAFRCFSQPARPEPLSRGRSPDLGVGSVLHFVSFPDRSSGVQHGWVREPAPQKKAEPSLRSIGRRRLEIPVRKPENIDGGRKHNYLYSGTKREARKRNSEPAVQKCEELKKEL